jgi:hypothetical protein
MKIWIIQMDALIKRVEDFYGQLVSQWICQKERTVSSQWRVEGLYEE